MQGYFRVWIRTRTYRQSQTQINIGNNAFINVIAKNRHRHRPRHYIPVKPGRPTWSKSMTLCPHRVQVVIGRLRQVGIVLTHGRHGRHQRDVVPLFEAVARRRCLVVGKGVAVIPTAAAGFLGRLILRVDKGVSLLVGQPVTEPDQMILFYKSFSLPGPHLYHKITI
jgi:hypothetical protein